MNIKIWAVLLVIILGFGTADARMMSLTLSLQPDVFTAHQRLHFEAKAFDKKWLEKEIACHFDVEKRCLNLAALLRMYVEAVPSKKKLKSFAYEIKGQLSHTDRKFEEIAMFLFLYCDDSSLIHVLDEYALADIQEKPVEMILTVDEINEKLSSDDETVVEQTLATLLTHPANVQMSEQVFEKVVQVTTNKALDRKTRSLASNYLSKMGFYVYYGEDEQGKFSFGTITIHSGGDYFTEYLARNPMSKVWKYHAKKLTALGLGDKEEDDTEIITFFKEINHRPDDEDRKKMAYIKRSKTYKKAAPSLKFIVGDGFMFFHEDIGLPIIKTAYKEGNNALKSAIVAKYTEHFPVNENYWDRLMKKSTAAEQVMIERSKKQWDINMKRLLKNK